MKFLSLLVVCLLSMPVLSARADSSCDGRCSAPPQVATNGMSFSTASQLYKNDGVAPQASELTGSWKTVGFFMSSQAIQADSSDASFVGFNPSGLKNKDGTNFDEVSILSSISSWTNQTVLNVAVNNMGRKGVSQGPYVLNLTGQAACYSFYANDGSHLEKSYYAVACRLMVKNRDQMVCELTDHIALSEYFRMSPAFRALNGQVMGVFLYTRE